MKKEPKDVDLLMFYRTDPEYDKEVKRFKYYIFGLLKTDDGLTILEHIASNHKVTLAMLKDMFPRLRVDLWAKYIKATGLMKRYYSYTFDPMDISKKVLREGMRGIQISELLHIDDKYKYGHLLHLHTKTFKLIWAEDNPEVDKNLLQTPEEQVAIILEEMENFMLQVEQQKSYYYVLSNVSKWVIEKIRVHNIVPDEEQVAKQFKIVGNERGILEPYLKWIIGWGLLYDSSGDKPRYNEKVSNLDIESEIAKIEVSVKDVSALGVLCESLRGEIKEYQSRCAFAKRLLSHLLFKDPYNPLPIEKRVVRCVLWTLRKIPMYEAKDDVKRRVLTDLGLDEISRNIVLVVSKRGGATYRLADSDEDLQELTDRSKKGKMEKEYEKYIRACARKAFPKDTRIRTFFTSSVGENGVPILDKVGLDVLSRDLDVADIDKLLHTAKKLGFRIKPESRIDPDHFTAEIDIDTSKLNGDKKLIKKLLESKLTLSPDAPPTLVAPA